MGGEWDSQDGVPAARSSQGKRKALDIILFTRRGGKSYVIHKHNFALSLLAPLSNLNMYIFQRPKQSIEASPCASYTMD